MNEVMTATGQEKIKGSLGYSFALSTSTKTEVDKDLLNECYLSQVQEAVKDILPADVSVSLSASISKFDGELLPIYYDRTETPTITFTKPRAKKED